MKNKVKRRMTRAEKIDAAEKLKRGVIEDPRMLRKAAPGTYTVTGLAAATVGLQSVNLDKKT